MNSPLGKQGLKVRGSSRFLRVRFGTVGPEGGGTHFVVGQDSASARRPGSMALDVVLRISEGELLVTDSSTQVH